MAVITFRHWVLAKTIAYCIILEHWQVTVCSIFTASSEAFRYELTFFFSILELAAVVCMIFIKWPAGRYTGRQKYQATHLFYTQVVVSSEKSRMDKTLLSQYFPTQGHLPESFARLFEHLEELSNVFYAIIVEDKGIYKYAYASPSIEKITGHEVARFS